MERSALELVEIARSPDEERIHELGLVVLSQRAVYWVAREERDFLLLVREAQAERLRRQVELYEIESVNWPPRLPEMQEADVSLGAAMAWLMAMILGYGVSARWPGLFEMGKVSAQAVGEGQYYRVFTALFLHMDIGHLVGNLLFGAVFLHLLARRVGGLAALISVLIAGALGNFLNAMVYYPEAHYSVGASTAVFGCIGILVALPLGFRLRHISQRLFSIWATPLVVGMVFLAWFGTGDERTDTSAHLMGFACGLPLGVALGWLSPIRSPAVREGRPYEG